MFVYFAYPLIDVWVMKKPRNVRATKCQSCSHRLLDNSLAWSNQCNVASSGFSSGRNFFWYGSGSGFDNVYHYKIEIIQLLSIAHSHSVHMESLKYTHQSHIIPFQILIIVNFIVQRPSQCSSWPIAHYFRGVFIVRCARPYENYTRKVSEYTGHSAKWCVL